MMNTNTEAVAMPELDRKALKEAALKATPGPWKASPSVDGDFYRVYPDTGRMEFPICSEPMAKRADVWKTDVDFIALANPATILSLLASLEEAEGRAEAWSERACGWAEAYDAIKDAAETDTRIHSEMIADLTARPDRPSRPPRSPR